MEHKLPYHVLAMPNPECSDAPCARRYTQDWAWRKAGAVEAMHSTREYSLKKFLIVFRSLSTDFFCKWSDMGKPLLSIHGRCGQASLKGFLRMHERRGYFKVISTHSSYMSKYTYVFRL
jgi:hypothetical protein